MSELDRAANPTIEEAIKYLERMLFTQDFSPSTLRAKAVNTMAIEALREQDEREKRESLCEHCNGVKMNFSCENEIWFDVDEIVARVTSKAKVPFCPACGKRLEVEP